MLTFEAIVAEADHEARMLTRLAAASAATRKCAELHETRDRLIWALYARGVPVRVIADVTRLTRQRVHRIIGRQ